MAAVNIRSIYAAVRANQALASLGNQYAVFFADNTFALLEREFHDASIGSGLSRP